mmetsp:Transcript_6061/g.25745  ORF Transcript_6061/g.25745 Transcript_6061/m.25745 type:complete len:211 (-) Transcript_6061:615-1247(-)
MGRSARAYSDERQGDSRHAHENPARLLPRGGNEALPSQPDHHGVPGLAAAHAFRVLAHIGVPVAARRGPVALRRASIRARAVGHARVPELFEVREAGQGAAAVPEHEHVEPAEVRVHKDADDLVGRATRARPERVRKSGKARAVLPVARAGEGDDARRARARARAGDQVRARVYARAGEHERAAGNAEERVRDGRLVNSKHARGRRATRT